MKVIDDRAKSEGVPGLPTGVKLLTKIDTVYSGLVALTAVPLTGIITAVTVVP